MMNIVSVRLVAHALVRAVHTRVNAFGINWNNADDKKRSSAPRYGQADCQSAAGFQHSRNQTTGSKRPQLVCIPGQAD